MWIAAAGAAVAVAETEPMLERMIAAALESNPDIQAAGARIAAARAAARQARAAGWPMLGAQAGYARTDNPPQAFMMTLNQRALDMRDPAFNPNEPDDTGNLRLSLGLRYALLDFGRRGAGVAAADAIAAARERAAEAVRNQLVFEVTRAYHGVLQAQEMVRVRAAQIASLEESLRIARARLEQGAAVHSDVLSLEVRLAEAREDEVRARNGVALAIAALNTVVGRDLMPTSGLPAASSGPIPALPPCEADEECLRRHPAMRAAEAAVEARRAAWRRARAEFRPTVNAFASRDWDSEDGDGFEGSYLAGVTAELELFSGGRREAAAAEARAELEAAEAEARRARDQLRLDLRQAAIQVREAFERWQVTEQAEASADEALRMTRARYEQGAADLAELLSADVGLASIRARRIAARYDYLTALSNLERARGRLGAAPSTTRTTERTPQ